MLTSFYVAMAKKYIDSHWHLAIFSRISAIPAFFFVELPVFSPLAKKKRKHQTYPLPPSPTTGKRSPMTRGVVVGHQNIAYDQGAGRWTPKFFRLRRKGK